MGLRYSQSTFVYYRYPLLEAISRLYSFGYTGVEIWGGRPHAYWEDMSGAHMEKVRSLLSDLKMEISCFIPAQFRYPTNLAASDNEMRLKSVDYIRKNIDVAAELGAPYVSLCPGFSLYGDSIVQAHARMVDSIKRLIDYAHDKPLTLLLEPAHSMETDLVLTVDDALRVIDEVGAENLGVLPDTGHLFINRESLSDTVKDVMAKGLSVHFQVDDNFGGSDDHLVPGEGKIDFDIFVRALEDCGYKGYLGIELGFGYTHDPDGAVLRSLRYLQSLERSSS